MVSIVIPVYNEGSVIIDTIDKINAVLEFQDYEYEIITVNDGSTDNTKILLEDRKDITLISRMDNKGYGYSLKEGIQSSKGSRILIIDADGSYPIEDIPLLIKESAFYEMVIGERTGKKVSINIFNKAAKLILRSLIFILTSKWIKDINSGLRIFNKELVLKYWSIIPDGFSFTTTITVAALIQNIRLKFIPINYFKRIGSSKIKPVQDFIGFIILVIRVTSFFKPLRIFLPISLFFFFATIIRSVRDIIMFNSIETLSVLLFILSLQTFFFGLIADMIVNQFNRKK
jgi:glycosyltransferase involved in cell wall biosynthesis